MFPPTKTYRRWHRKVNKTQRQQAVSAALSTTAKTPLVMARGHSIESLKECPVVVDAQVQPTKSAIQILVDLGLTEELERCKVIRCVALPLSAQRMMPTSLIKKYHWKLKLYFYKISCGL